MRVEGKKTFRQFSAFFFRPHFRNERGSKSKKRLFGFRRPPYWIYFFFNLEIVSDCSRPVFWYPTRSSFKNVKFPETFLFSTREKYFFPRKNSSEPSSVKETEVLRLSLFYEFSHKWENDAWVEQSHQAGYLSWHRSEESKIMRVLELRFLRERARELQRGAALENVSLIRSGGAYR